MTIITKDAHQSRQTAIQYLHNGLILTINKQCVAVTGKSECLMISTLTINTMAKNANKNSTNRAQFVKKLSNFMLSISKRHDLGRNTILQHNSYE